MGSGRMGGKRGLDVGGVFLRFSNSLLLGPGTTDPGFMG